ncbi:MAG TPA: glucosamine-6-phosphate deaminase [Planctomycetes bacterium]|nr:glucosamine-6-phosphate deaminase [Planctomycetota bacterium]
MRRVDAFSTPVFVTRDESEAAERVAGEIARLLRAKPDVVLGLASGHTPLALYRRLVELHGAGLDFSAARTFNLDVYEGLNGEEPWSFRAFMRTVLFEPAEFSLEKTHFPARRSESEPPAEAARRFEEEIRNAGGIDLQILGIGRNGHIGFNEPGSEPSSRTRRVELCEETRRVNRADFPPGVEVPTHAMTMGIATILGAKKLRVLAFGESKAGIIRRALLEPMSPKLPATYLRGHPAVELWLDEAAARLL